MFIRCRKQLSLEAQAHLESRRWAQEQQLKRAQIQVQRFFVGLERPKAVAQRDGEEWFTAMM